MDHRIERSGGWRVLFPPVRWAGGLLLGLIASFPASSLAQTATFTRTPTATVTSTRTSTYTRTATFTGSPTPLITATFTRTATSTNTLPPPATYTSTATATLTGSPAYTYTSTATYTRTSTPTGSPTPTQPPPPATFTQTPTSSQTPLPPPATFTRTSTSTRTPTSTPDLSATPTATWPSVYTYNNPVTTVAGVIGCTNAAVSQVRDLNLEASTAYMIMRITVTCGCTVDDIMQLRLTKGWDEICLYYGIDWTTFVVDLQARLNNLPPEIITPNQIMRAVANDPNAFPIVQPPPMPDHVGPGNPLQESCASCQ